MEYCTFQYKCCPAAEATVPTANQLVAWSIVPSKTNAVPRAAGKVPAAEATVPTANQLVA